MLTVLCLILLTAQASRSEDTVLAKIGDKKITTEDFERIISYYPEERKKVLEQKPENKAVLLKRIVQTYVLSEIARKEGFDKKNDIKEQVDLLVNDFISSQYLKKEITDKIVVKEEDMDLYYKTHLDEFKTPEMVKARHILIKVDKSASEEEKKKAKEKAEDIFKKIKSGEDFSKLASEFSDDPGSKKKGGDLGFLPKGKTVPSFEKAAFSLKVGEVSDIVETNFGYHIIKVEDKKEASQEPFEKVREKVRKKAMDEFTKSKVSEFLEKAFIDAGVEMHLELLIKK